MIAFIQWCDYPTLKTREVREGIFEVSDYAAARRTFHVIGLGLKRMANVFDLEKMEWRRKDYDLPAPDWLNTPLLCMNAIAKFNRTKEANQKHEAWAQQQAWQASCKVTGETQLNLY